MWTWFHDMHSGGWKRTPYAHIFIELPEAEAKEFMCELGRDPEHVTCDCCGQDYSVSDFETLEQATGYNRDCEWDDAGNGYLEETRRDRYGIGIHYTYRTVEEYRQDPEVLIVNKEEVDFVRSQLGLLTSHSLVDVARLLLT